jgi:hypothetical protein
VVGTRLAVLVEEEEVDRQVDGRRDDGGREH